MLSVTACVAQVKVFSVWSVLCSLPPVVKKLHKAQQRAHNEMEAAEKQANQLRFQEEAGQRFVSSARKHKSELDSTIYEHGREIRLRSTHD